MRVIITGVDDDGVDKPLMMLVVVAVIMVMIMMAAVRGIKLSDNDGSESDDITDEVLTVLMARAADDDRTTLSLTQTIGRLITIARVVEDDGVTLALMGAAAGG